MYITSRKSLLLLLSNRLCRFHDRLLTLWTSALPFLSPNGDVVFFDVQTAAPGTFTVPGVIDLEIYEPGSIVETSWIYFKGDPQTGPQPEHPFERPFNDSARFSIDMVRDDETGKVLHEIMRKSFLLNITPQMHGDE